ncbi:BgTH12-06904, partial [Blumeria graminis f. sp. triticale]
SEAARFKATTRLQPSHSLITIEAAKRPNHSPLDSDSLLSHELLIVTFSEGWGVSHYLKRGYKVIRNRSLYLVSRSTHI